MNKRMQKNCGMLGMLAAVMGCAAELVVDEGAFEGGGGGTNAPAAGMGGSNAANSTSGATTVAETVGTTGSVEGASNYCRSILPGDGTLWAGSPDGCPEVSPDSFTCDAAVPGPCTYTLSDGESTTTCSCLYDRYAGAPRWSCEPAGDYTFTDCPELPPEVGSSCFGARGHQCAYPSPLRVTCTCSDTEDPVWSCFEVTNGREGLPLKPAQVDLETRVSELTEAERGQLCEWLEQWARGGLGYPPGDPVAVGADGFTLHGACAISEKFRDAWAFPTTLSQQQCAANLALSSCEAPVSELVDCVISIRDADLEHQRSCGAYFEREACNGTSVTANDICNTSVPTEEACSIQVE